MRWLTARQAAEYLGVSVKEIYRVRRTGALQVSTVGDSDRNFRTTEGWLDEMMLRRTTPSIVHPPLNSIRPGGTPSGPHRASDIAAPDAA